MTASAPKDALPKAPTTSGSSGNASSTPARRPSLGGATGNVDDAMRAKAAEAQAGTNFAAASAALVPPENAAQVKTDAPVGKSAAGDDKAPAAAAGGPAAAGRPTGKVELKGFATSKPDDPANGYPARFRRDMDLAETETQLAIIRATGEKRELGAIFDAQGFLQRLVLGSAAEGTKSAAIDTKVLFGGDSEHGAINIAGGSTVTHTHPQGMPLSFGDILMQEREGIKILRAVGLCNYQMLNPTGAKSGESEGIVAIEHSRGTQQLRARALEKFGTLQVRIGADTFDLSNAEVKPGKFLAEFCGCLQVAAKTGWTFSTTWGDTLEAYGPKLFADMAGGADWELVRKQSAAIEWAGPKADAGSAAAGSTAATGAAASGAAAKPKAAAKKPAAAAGRQRRNSLG